MIESVVRYRPFSHEPGTAVQLPRSPLYARVYPTKIICGSCEIAYPAIEEEFTITQDLEKGIILISGKRVQYTLAHRGKELFFNGKGYPVAEEAFSPSASPRLHLGVNKKQDWRLLHRRLDPVEFLPIWFHAGAQIHTVGQPKRGAGKLLTQLEEAIRETRRLEIVPLFKKLFAVGFDGLLVPKLNDTHFLGLLDSGSTEDPLPLLSYGATLIQRLFLEEREDGIHILPCLPPEFHCGRLIGAQLGPLTIDLEWSKKQIKKVSLSAPATLHFPKDIKRFRQQGLQFDRFEK